MGATYVLTVADLDLLELLAADHQRLLGEEPPSVADLSQHLSVERDLLYPAIRHHVEHGDAVVQRLRRAERRLEDSMADLEHGGAAQPERVIRLMSALREHVDTQERLFTGLRRVLPPESLVRSAQTVPLSIGGSPTHAHPHLAEGGPMGEIVEDLASVSDHVRDRLQPRDEHN